MPNFKIYILHQRDGEQLYICSLCGPLDFPIYTEKAKVVELLWGRACKQYAEEGVIAAAYHYEEVVNESTRKDFGLNGKCRYSFYDYFICHLRKNCGFTSCDEDVEGFEI